MTKEEKKKWLNRLREGREELARLEDRRLTLYERATRTTSSLSAARASGSIEERIFTSVAIAGEEIQAQREKLRAVKLETLREIMKLEAAMERVIMIQRYINLKPWPEIAEAVELNVRQVYNIHKQGMEKIL